MDEIKIGDVYMIRYIPTLSGDKLHKVKVTGVFKLGDGMIIVRFKYNFPLTIYEDMEVTEFINNSTKI